jgi:hypothetical protein
MQMFNIFTSLILIATFFGNFITCNIWDNIFSQLNSPQLVLPSESKVELFNKENKMMEVLISSQRNILKVSLLDKNLVKNITGQNSSDIVDIYVNFTNSFVSFDFEDSCRFKNISVLNKFKLKFFLASYDILTLFKNGEIYYEYVFTNPLGKQNKNNGKKYTGQGSNLRSLRNLQLNFLEDENKNKIDESFTKLDLTKIFDIKGLMEQDSMLIFNVNKTTQILENINMKIYGIDSVYNAITTLVDQFDDESFRIKHNCTLIKVDDS